MYKAQLTGSCVYQCSRRPGAQASLHFRGGRVASVSVDGVAVAHALQDPGALVDALSTPERGLESRQALEAEVGASASGELTLSVPEGACTGSGHMVVEVRFETTGDCGPLRYAPFGADGGCAVTLMRPELAGDVCGARCVFPCVDGTRYAQALEVTLLGSDEEGRLPSRGAEGASRLQQMVVLASGGLGSGVAGGSLRKSSTQAKAGKVKGSRGKTWRFNCDLPLPPHAVGFVTAPLARAESKDIELHVAQVAEGAGIEGRAAQGVRITHFCAPGKVAEVSTLHARRTRRMLLWFAEAVGAPYPLREHSHVYLPVEVFAPIAGLAAAAGGLLPSARASSSSLPSVHGLVELDVFAMAGLTLLPDSLLASGRVVDEDAGAHRAQAAGIARSLFGCIVSSASWRDAWVTAGAAGYLVDCYMRSFRSAADWDVAASHLNEAVARLEEEHPELLPLCPQGAFADERHASCATAAAHPLRPLLLALKPRAVWRSLAGSVGEEAVKRVLCAALRGGAAGGRAGGGSLTTPALLTLVKAAVDVTGGGTRWGGGASVAAAAGFGPVDLFAHQWVHGRGVPHLLVGVHINSVSNAVEVVVEQVLRLGDAKLRPELPPSPYSDVAAALFLGPLTVNIVERPDASAEEGLHDTWTHTLFISKVREVFILPVHTRVTRTPLERLAPLGGKKRGRPRVEKNMALVEAVAKSSEGRGKDEGGHPDELNDTSVLRVRVDPALAWIMRLHLAAPPALLLSSIREDPSVAAQLQALAALAAIGHGSFASVPRGLTPGPVTDATPFPAIPADAALPGGPQPAFARDVASAASMTVDARVTLTTVGVLPRPAALLTPLYRLVAVGLGIDPAAIALPRAVAEGGGAAVAAHAAARGLGAGPRLSLSGAGLLETDWRVAGFALAGAGLWSSGHLPSYAAPAGPHHTWAGVGTLIGLYQGLFYAEAEGRVDAALGAAADGTVPAAVSSLLRAAELWDEAALALIASGGKPAPLSVTSLEDVSRRASLLAAIASVRQRDGVTPDSILLFLTTVLRSYDASRTSNSVDDSALLASLVTGLGAALVDSDGARAVRNLRVKKEKAAAPQEGAAAGGDSWEAWVGPIPPENAASVAALEEGFTALREQVALELSSMQHAARIAVDGAADAEARAAAVCPALDAATSGRVAAAAIAAVTVLESSGAAPIVVAPTLSALLLPTSVPAPDVVKLAAMVGITRVLVGAGPARHPSGLLGWTQAIYGLLAAVLLPSPAGPPPSEALVQCCLVCFYVLQGRTDRPGTLRLPGSIDAHRSPPIQARVEYDLRRLNGIADPMGGDLMPAVIEDVRTAGFATRWRYPELAIDLGIEDAFARRLTLAERRSYAGYRFAPSHPCGLLSPLLTASQTPATADEARRALALLWDAAGQRTPSSSVRGAARSLIASIWGLSPLPSSLFAQATTGRAFAALDLACLAPSARRQFLASLHATADARRGAIMSIRSSCRALHSVAEVAYAMVKDLPASTGTRVVVRERAPARAGEVEAGGEEGEEEEEEEAKEEPVNETPTAVPATVPTSLNEEDGEADYNFEAEEEDRPRAKRGRPKKVVAPPAAQASAPALGARPGRAASAGLAEVLRNAAGEEEDEDFGTAAKRARTK